MTGSGGQPQQGLLRRLRKRLAESIPSPWTILIGSVLFGALCAASAMAGLYLRYEFLFFSNDAIVLLYFFGAAVGFAPGLVLANLIAGRARRPARFVIGAIILFLSGHTATAAIFALQYRMFYAHWHADFPSIIWGLQLVFTSAAAIYQFTVNSLYLSYPLAPVIVIGLGLWFAAQSRPATQ